MEKSLSIRTGPPLKFTFVTDEEILGGYQFESSKHFTYRKKLVIFRGGPVKKNTLYIISNQIKYHHDEEKNLKKNNQREKP